MVSDAYRSTCCHNVLARAVGDREQAARSSYIGSRTAMTLAASQLEAAIEYQYAVTNTLSAARGTGRVGFYVFEWVNTVKEAAFAGAADYQLGLATVESIDLLSNGTNIPMVFAITAECDK